MIEMIGVLAIIAILATVLTPVLIKTADRLAYQAEATEVKDLTAALKRHILRTRSIPAAGTFAQVVGPEAGVAATRVLTNARGLRRVYLIDPAVTNTLPIPYVQDWMGVTNDLPQLMGVMLVSSIHGELPTNLISGFASTSATFSNIWNTAPGVLPAGWTWQGDPEDLVIERLNLRSLFVPLTLTYDSWSAPMLNAGRFTIDNSTTNVLPGSARAFTSHYFSGTLLGLHDHAGATNTLQTSEVLQEPVSFFYEVDTWRGELFVGPRLHLLTGSDLQAIYNFFLPAPWNSNAKRDTHQVDVTQSMSNYMVLYLLWAQAGFSSDGSGDRRTVQADLEQAATDLIFKP